MLCAFNTVISFYFLTISDKIPDIPFIFLVCTGTQQLLNFISNVLPAGFVLISVNQKLVSNCSTALHKGHRNWEGERSKLQTLLMKKNLCHLVEKLFLTSSFGLGPAASFQYLNRALENGSRPCSLSP